MKTRKGFTLIELLIVITIIGILAVALLPRLLNSPARARDVARKASLQNIVVALESYYSDNGTYPASTGVCFNATTGGIGTQVAQYLRGTVNDPIGTNPLSLSVAGLDCKGDFYYRSLTNNAVSDASFLIITQTELDATTEGYVDLVEMDVAGGLLDSTFSASLTQADTFINTCLDSDACGATGSAGGLNNVFMIAR